MFQKSQMVLEILCYYIVFASCYALNDIYKTFLFHRRQLNKEIKITQ